MAFFSTSSGFSEGTQISCPPSLVHTVSANEMYLKINTISTLSKSIADLLLCTTCCVIYVIVCVLEHSEKAVKKFCYSTVPYRHYHCYYHYSDVFSKKLCLQAQNKQSCNCQGAMLKVTTAVYHLNHIS